MEDSPKGGCAQMDDDPIPNGGANAFNANDVEGDAANIKLLKCTTKYASEFTT